MAYENRPVPEGINVSQDHPLKEFTALAVGVSGIVVIAVIILALSAEYLVRFIPFAVEKHLAEKIFAQTPLAIIDENSDDNPPEDKLERYLQQLTNKLVSAQQLPENISVTLHYLSGDTVNAFATLGGHIFIYQGLLAKMPSENALSMVLAHEVAHIKHRDPIIAIGRGLTVSLALASLAGLSDTGFMDGLVGQVGTLTALTFSRDQESHADLEAIDTLRRYYGHVNGAEALFEIFADQQSINIPAFLSTHPLTQERLDRIKSLNDDKTIKLQALPDFVTVLASP